MSATEANDLRWLCLMEVLSCGKIPVLFLVYQIYVCNLQDSAISKLCYYSAATQKLWLGPCTVLASAADAADVSEDILDVHIVQGPTW